MQAHPKIQQIGNKLHKIQIHSSQHPTTILQTMMKRKKFVQ
jgi:hypothetical protein